MKSAMQMIIIYSFSEQVHRHLEQHEVKYLQFAFRWMNNLLMREVPLQCTIRLWDTYQVNNYTELALQHIMGFEASFLMLLLIL